MIENIQRDQKQNAIKTAQPPQTRIIIRRTFGEQSFLELYSDYVAEKVKEHMDSLKGNKGQSA